MKLIYALNANPDRPFPHTLVDEVGNTLAEVRDADTTMEIARMCTDHDKLVAKLTTADNDMDKMLAELRQAVVLRNCLVRALNAAHTALEHSSPTHAHHVEPVERHAAAQKAVITALDAAKPFEDSP